MRSKECEIKEYEVTKDGFNEMHKGQVFKAYACHEAAFLRYGYAKPITPEEITEIAPEKAKKNTSRTRKK